MKQEFKDKIIDMYFIEGMKMSDIGNIVGYSQSTISNIICSIKKRSERFSHTLGKKGTINGGGKKLNEVDVIEIFKSNDGFKELSLKYNVTTTMIHRIKNRKVWIWLTESLK